MPARAHILLVAALLAAAACNSPVESPPSPLAPIALDLSMSSSPAFTNSYRWMTVRATNSYGARVSAKKAQVTPSDSQVAAVEAVYSVTDGTGTVDSAESLQVLLHFLAPGSVTLRVTLFGLVKELDLAVQALPEHTGRMTVDTFTVLEVPECGVKCFTYYAPILRLHADSMGGSLEVTNVEFDIPNGSRGLCDGSFRYAPGQSADLVYYEEDAPIEYASNLTLYTADGTTAPDGPATARVIVRDSSGALGLVEASGTIQRNVALPDLPRTEEADLLNWSCP